MRTLLAILIGIFALVVIGATEEPTLTGYDTLEEAGVHAIQRAKECSIYYECGGVIAQRPDGKFVVGPVDSDDDGTSVGLTYAVPNGYKLVADYHTHPCLDKLHLPSYFSPPDVAGNTMHKITGFMGDLCTGDVHEFTPGRDIPNDVEIAPGFHLTDGRIVGHIQTPGVVVEPNTGL